MADSLEKIAEEIANFTESPLLAEATNPVPGEGNPKAEILFVGEAPGEKEDKLGRPFVGAAGKFLAELLESIDLKRQDVFITNIVKHRPPGNRDPEPAEIELYLPFLMRQISIIQPLLIVTLGRHSMNHFLPDEKISAVHGQPRQVITPSLENLYILPLYHPAAALYQGSQRAVHLKDFSKIPKIIASIKKQLS
jgi:uracil-DNA glycosylase